MAQHLISRGCIIQFNVFLILNGQKSDQTKLLPIKDKESLESFWIQL